VIDGGLFADPDEGDVLTYAAGLANGAGLPSWLSFDATTRTFSGTPTADAESISVRLTATDRAGVRVEHLFAIDITEAAVGQAPTDVALSGTSVLENAAGGTVVGTFSASDPDSDTFTFQLVDDAAGLFVIDGSALAVAGGAALDHETAARHEIIVRVTDLDGLSYEKTLAIDVADVEETQETSLGDGTDVFEATSADDWTVYGLGGNDRLTGNAGNDSLFGGAGNDGLIGGEGDDWIDGGTGNDVLTGGEGRDVFVFDTAVGTGKDRITDFGRDDVLMTRRPIRDSNRDGTIDFGSNRVLDLVGGGKVTIADTDGDPVRSLTFDGINDIDGVSYYVYILT
jgi:hypothetical protein